MVQSVEPLDDRAEVKIGACELVEGPEVVFQPQKKGDVLFDCPPALRRDRRAGIKV